MTMSLKFLIMIIALLSGITTGVWYGRYRRRQADKPEMPDSGS